MGYKKIYKGRKYIKDEHRYIMEQYLGRKLERWEVVHHINENKKDNRIENLRVMTQEEHNKLHKEKLLKTKICIECGKEFEPPVKHRGRNTICSKECWVNHQKKVSPFQNKTIASFKDNKEIKRYKSIKEASQELNGSSSNIVKCLKRKTKTAYGYKWEYIKE